MSRINSLPLLRRTVNAAACVLRGEHVHPVAAANDAAGLGGHAPRLFGPSLGVMARAGIGPTRPDAGGVAARNEARLGRLTVLLSRRRGEPEAVLLGDAALLGALYKRLDAFDLELPIVGTSGHADGHVSGLEGMLRAGGSDGAVVSLGVLAPRIDRHATRWTAAGLTWLVPDRQLLLVLLAARVGDPLAHPEPPLWHHLALALQVWEAEADPAALLSLAGRYGVAAQLRRGLAIVRHLFPDLRARLSGRSLELPLLEATLAVPLAARKLLALAFDGEAEPSVAPLGAPTAAPL